MISAYGVEDYVDGKMVIPEKYLPGTSTIFSKFSVRNCINGTIRS